jgi:polyhydroxybutyrate depolymerase
LTDKLAAIAAVAATMPETQAPVCKPSVPISVMFIHGSKDPLVHIDGGPVLRDRGVAISLAQAPAFWRKWDGASSQPAVETLLDQAHDGTSVRHEAGGKQLPAFLIGRASHNLDATQTIWDFFKRHAR